MEKEKEVKGDKFRKLLVAHKEYIDTRMSSLIKNQYVDPFNLIPNRVPDEIYIELKTMCNLFDRMESKIESEIVPRKLNQII